MRSSRFSISTLRETPADAEVVSHRLMLRAGLIRKLASGLYTWSPLGLRVLQKVERIVREEMNRAGALEVLMPIVQPAELWQESQRWEKYDTGLLLRMKDRHGRDFCFGPTHEEVITDYARNELKSHRQLPVNYYQIQTKFRDETRPRFGVMRAREFLMKDAYSFHLTPECMQQCFNDMHVAYSRIFSRIGFRFRAVQADSGSIGGDKSVEFHVLAESGEDLIAYSNASSYAANIERAEAGAPQPEAACATELVTVATPGCRTIEEVSAFLAIESRRTIKTLIVKGATQPLVALVLRGDHQLNPVKAIRHELVASPLTFATEAEILEAVGCTPGSLGPLGLQLPVIVDPAAAALAHFVCGANREGFHYQGAQWQRDCRVDATFDLRTVVEGDPSPDGEGTLEFARGIEVGHIFQLGDAYSAKMNASVLDEQGRARIMLMGCYGIGVSRTVAAAIEQNHDEHGIIWPDAIAPFQVIIVPVNAHRSEAVRRESEALYERLLAAGLDVLIDDRDGVRPGAKFAEADLIGVPHRITVGDRGLEQGLVEHTLRRGLVQTQVPVAEAAEFLLKACAAATG